MEVKIGGERLGSGNKMKAYLNNYNRSTHDLGYLWRSTISPGTLVPFMCEFVNRGDSIDINLNCDIKTPPTVGPLFGSAKVQLDVFAIPLRLYNSKVHMNALNIGRDMSQVCLPQIEVSANDLDNNREYDNQQINPSCLLSYLGIRGLGHWDGTGTIINNTVKRKFNATPLLAYWDIYKNYYANKSEPNGWVVHKDLYIPAPIINRVTAFNTLSSPGGGEGLPTTPGTYNCYFSSSTSWVIQLSGGFSTFDAYNNILIKVKDLATSSKELKKLGDIFNYISFDAVSGGIICNFLRDFTYFNNKQILEIYTTLGNDIVTSSPTIFPFPLDDIDNMRENLLKHFSNNPYVINGSGFLFNQPYSLYTMTGEIDGKTYYPQMYSQEGLAIKTYQSDIFNNWLNKEWVEGNADSIAEITKVDTSTGAFTIDELNLSKKIFNLLTRISLSGGSYSDWLEAVYEEGERPIEEPIYIGGLSKELVFQEVVSNASTENEPLGTIAARGTLGSKHKGGNIIYKVKEPMIIMGIVSITPRIDYSQGNRWFNDLKTWDDFHKPALDQIGFQNLPTDWMAFFDTPLTNNGTEPLFKSAGKQPAWIHYTTNYNRVYGNFADNNNMMFMAFNRKYGSGTNMSNGLPQIDDLTTYIDPRKYNNIFADERIDAMNYWVQISCDITARRLMSASLIPNL